MPSQERFQQLRWGHGMCVPSTAGSLRHRSQLPAPTMERMEHLHCTGMSLYRAGLWGRSVFGKEETSRLIPVEALGRAGKQEEEWRASLDCSLQACWLRMCKNNN